MALSAYKSLIPSAHGPHKSLGAAAFFLFLIVTASFAQQTPGCEISNTGADTGTASIDATPGYNYSAPNGIGAVGFRISVACQATNVGYHVVNYDSASHPSNVYDIGLYCFSGDCCGPQNTLCSSGSPLYVHTGLIYGPWFTNDRQAYNYQDELFQVTNSTITIQGTAGYPLWPEDFPVYETVTPAGTQCGSFSNVTFTVQSVSLSPQVVVTVTTSQSPSGQGYCSFSTTNIYPPGFTSGATVCNPADHPADACQEALRWMADSSTVCKAIPCTLPAGLYAAAIGTDCANSNPTDCAQLLGDADLGLIYPFTAWGSNFVATSGLPPNMNGFTFSSGAVWETGSTTTNIKPPKLLIY